MKILLNDLSLHGQFQNIKEFQNSIAMIMRMRREIIRFGRELRCHRKIAYAQITHKLTMQQAIQAFNESERRAVMVWLTQRGPFWEDTRDHACDDYFAYKESVVTDLALGEAAYGCFNDSECHTVSLTPSDWQFTPVPVAWHSDNTVTNIDVPNHWAVNTLETVLQNASPPAQSWQQLATDMQVRCTNLTFAADSFAPLYSHPFVPSVAERIVKRLEILDKFKCCFDAQGQRTLEGQHIYKTYFMGKKALFSDSSDGEKRKFETELTFKHPDNNLETLFCPWHGKEKTDQRRIHFSWPIRANEKLYVVYVGPKITRR